MDLPNLFSSPAAADSLFIGIVLTSHTVQVALWKVESQQIVIKQRSVEYEYSDDESCLVNTDTALQDLGKESEDVQEVVFGFEPTWVTAAGIADVRKPLLKKITQKLSLKPVGFVVINEALFQQLKHQEPFISCLVGLLQSDQLAVLLIHQGILLATEHVGRSGNSAADFTEALARFQANDALPSPLPLPTKILLAYTGISAEEATEQQQLLIDEQWVEHHGFVQAPTVDILPAQQILEAVVLQGGQAVAESQGLLPPKNQLATSAMPPTTAAVTNQADFGFSSVATDEEAELSVNEVEPVADWQTAVPDHAQSSFGVPIALHHLPGATHSSHHSHQATALDQEDDVYDHQEPVPTRATRFSLQHVKRFILAHRVFISVGFGAGVITLMGMGYLLLKTTTQAYVQLSLKTLPISTSVKVTLDPQSKQSDPDKKILAATVVTKEVSQTKAQPSTGVKLVGDKAKGTITLINKTDSTKTLAAGTKLSAGSLLFTLDKDVTVASASVSRQGSDGETKTYGKSDGSVTAAAIGEANNLAKDKELKVADFANNTYAAVAKTDITGGTSREIQVVSEKDRETLLAQVKTELLKQAADEFKKETANGQYVVPTGNLTTVKAEYDAKVGDEVGSLELTLLAKVEGIAYQVSDLQPLAAAFLADQIPAGYVLSEQPPEMLSQPAAATSPTASKSAQLLLDMNISSQAVPSLDVAALQQELRGLSLKTAQERLQAKAEIASATLTFQPALAKTLLPHLPGQTTRIHIETNQ